MLIGYARVSSNDQDAAAQVAALKAAKCERIYREQASGGRWDRPELQRPLWFATKSTSAAAHAFSAARAAGSKRHLRPDCYVPCNRRSRTRTRRCLLRAGPAAFPETPCGIQ